MSLPKLAITLGDRNGIGPEITAKWLSRREKAIPTDYTVDIIGDCNALEEMAKRIQRPISVDRLESMGVELIHVEADSIGETSYRAIEIAARGCLDETYAAMVTGPVSKAQLQSSGFEFGGHTEILETLAKESYPDCHAEMLFLYQQFRLMLLTRHIPLSQVSSHLSVQNVHASLSQLLTFLQTHLQSPPRIAVMGLNPHAGEISGTEETEILKPAMDSLNTSAETQIFHGPFSADALMRGFNALKPEYDAYVACYHDQGLIPMKLLGGLHAVNVTIGLPFIRTSVSHGTAEDIAGLGIADETSLVAAIDMAYSLSHCHTVPLPANILGI